MKSVLPLRGPACRRRGRFALMQCAEGRASGEMKRGNRNGRRVIRARSLAGLTGFAASDSKRLEGLAAVTIAGLMTLAHPVATFTTGRARLVHSVATFTTGRTRLI